MNANTEQWSVTKRCLVSELGAVSSQHWLASRVGASVLAQGGHAVDGALACAFALGVLEPWMSGLGGNGFMLVWQAREQACYRIDFQGVLPHGIDPADYPLDSSVASSLMGFPGVVDNRNVVGFAAALVPGAVAGFAQAHRRFGALAFDTLLAPAVELAERGLPVDWHTTLQVALAMDVLRSDETASRIFLPCGVPPKPEQHLPMEALAATLRALQLRGPEDFYQGAIAQTIAADLHAGGSRITAADLARYEAHTALASSGTHRDATLYTAGPTSGGPRMLHALAHSAANLHPHHAPDARAYASYTAALDSAFAQHAPKSGVSGERGCTTHLSVVDKDSNMVALTTTLLSRFGAGVVLPSSGILMNNAVSYFDPRPGFETSMAPGKRINSSNMCPTIATRDGHALFALGASGANHIVPCVTQLAALLLDYGLSLETAFHAPRIDASNRQSVRVDPALGSSVINELDANHSLELAQSLVFPKLFACPSGVQHDAKTGLNYAMSDRTSPVAGAAVEGPLALDSIASGPAPVRA